MQLAEAPQQGDGGAQVARTSDVRIGVKLPANHDEIAGEVAKRNAVLDLV